MLLVQILIIYIFLYALGFGLLDQFGNYLTLLVQIDPSYDLYFVEYAYACDHYLVLHFAQYCLQPRLQFIGFSQYPKVNELISQSLVSEMLFFQQIFQAFFDLFV